MLKKFFAAITFAAALAGCTATSGPTFQVLDIQLTNGQKGYKAECYGLFSSAKSCMEGAQKVCGNQPVRILQTSDGTIGANNPREVIFDCSAPAPATATAPAAVEPVATPEPVAPRKVTLDEKFNFDFDSAELKPHAKEILEKLVAESKDVTYSSVSIAGYADGVGDAPYNVGLSQRRANSVLKYLQMRGLKANDFKVQGFGKSDPVATNATAAGRAENRRVEILLTQ